MLDLGWQEFFLIATIAVVVVGPKDLPNVIRAVMQWIRKIRTMAREFQGSIEEIAREAELDEVRRKATKLMDQDLSKTILDAVDPDRGMTNSLKGTHTDAEVVDTPGKIRLLGDNAIGGWDAETVSGPTNSVDPGAPAAAKAAAQALAEEAGVKPTRKRAAKPKATSATAAAGFQAMSKRVVKGTTTGKLRKPRALPKAKNPGNDAEGESAPDPTLDTWPATPETEA
jgi:sec-independent protein translocase protein TatB